MGKKKRVVLLFKTYIIKKIIHIRSPSLLHSITHKKRDYLFIMYTLWTKIYTPYYRKRQRRDQTILQHKYLNDSPSLQRELLKISKSASDIIEHDGMDTDSENYLDDYDNKGCKQDQRTNGNKVSIQYYPFTIDNTFRLTHRQDTISLKKDITAYNNKTQSMNEYAFKQLFAKCKIELKNESMLVFNQVYKFLIENKFCLLLETNNEAINMTSVAYSEKTSVLKLLYYRQTFGVDDKINISDDLLSYMEVLFETTVDVTFSNNIDIFPKAKWIMSDKDLFCVVSTKVDMFQVMYKDTVYSHKPDNTKGTTALSRIGHSTSGGPIINMRARSSINKFRNNMTNTIIQQIDNARCPISTIHESDTGSINDDNDDDDGEDLQEDLQEEGDDISYEKGSPTSSSPVLISDDILSSRPSSTSMTQSGLKQLRVKNGMTLLKRKLQKQRQLKKHISGF